MYFITLTKHPINAIITLNQQDPNVKAMKKFCSEYWPDYKIIEKEWLIR